MQEREKGEEKHSSSCPALSENSPALEASGFFNQGGKSGPQELLKVGFL